MTCYAVYFSPTGTTRHCVQAICQSIDKEFREIDLTLVKTRKERYAFQPDDLVIIGFPVYGGRLPTLPESPLVNLCGHGAKACALVTYGNRAYEDALLELADLCKAAKFDVIAGAAFVGQHTYSASIATGRPDDQDNQALQEFAVRLGKKWQNYDASQPTLPGNRPYKDWLPMPLAPQPTEDCIECGTCASVCPVEAIPQKPPYVVADPALCIDCFACVKACPTGGRDIIFPPFQEKIAALAAHLQGVRHEPEYFL